MNRKTILALIAKEGDSRSFTHAGLRCEMRRMSDALHWCGYVGVPEAHPLYMEDYRDVACDVHGGLTWAKDTWPVKGVGLWWFGFDCAHVGDWTLYAGGRLGGDYRTAEYVEAETRKLAEQLAAMANKNKN